MSDPLRILLIAAWLAVVGAGEMARAEPSGAPQPRRERVDTSTLTGKVMCGYQGWFNCEGDGAGLGWTHWARDRHRLFGPGNAAVDLWPDVSELGPDERFATGFRHADGRAAEVFSSAHRDTVSRHFQWMQEYGIDGAFVQRFANGLSSPKLLQHKDTVLSHARAGAAEFGRAYAVMYDLSGLGHGETSRVRRDWSRLRKEARITDDPAYLNHEGQPVVAVWGIGFNDGRRYSLAECRDLVRWLKQDGCSVMLGVPTGWREGSRDAVDQPQLQELIKLADVVSPWTVGRYRNVEEAGRHGREVWQADRAWCDEHQLDLLPVVFPGFSWHNLKGHAFDAIPRENGRFLWSQVVAAQRAGCDMIYVAMFDEVDEGTAIFKCSSDPPVGDGVQFLSFPEVPSDHYLWLTGEAARLLRGERPLQDAMPEAE